MASKGGAKVKAGFYWRRSQWEIVPLSGAGGVLPGGPEETYHRIPVLVMLAVAPIMGALFVVFLPFIGFALLLQYLAQSTVRASRHAAGELAATLGPSWRPGEAFFFGRHKKGEKKQDAAADAKIEKKLDEIEKEIDSKKQA
jgi:hypothetical protein